MKRFKTICMLLIAAVIVLAYPFAAQEHVHAVASGDFYGTCPVCGEWAAHVEQIYQQPTCTDNGYGTVYCTSCGRTGLETVFYAYGHNYVKTVTKKAGCEEEGLNTFTCQWCGHKYTETVKATGHDIEYEDKDPTCTEDGYHNGTCKKCGEVFETVIPALGHDYPDEWTVEKESGYFKRGLQSKVCKVCGEKLTEDIPRKNPLPLIIAAAIVLAVLCAVMAVTKKRKNKAAVVPPEEEPKELPSGEEKGMADAGEIKVEAAVDIAAAAIARALSTAAGAAEEVTEEAPAAVEEVAEEVKAVAEEAATEVQAAVEETAEEIPAAVEETVEEIPLALEEAAEEVKAAAEEAADEVPAVVEEVIEEIPAAVEKTVEEIPVAVEEAAEEVKAVAEEAAVEVPAAVEEAIEEIPAAAEPKKVFICSENERLKEILSSAHDLSVEFSGYDGLYEKLDGGKADLLVLDVSDNRRYEDVLAAKEYRLADTHVFMIICGEPSEEGRRELQELVDSGTIAGFAFEDDNPYEMAVDLKLILSE